MAGILDILFSEFVRKPQHLLYSRGRYWTVKLRLPGYNQKALDGAYV